ncbi:transcriptional regulator-like protein [Legionella gratiana]|uniref:Transcriptional regulator-like protein n=1 Tax=Legionella gratiana TaxID=45066 RepID=A0A378JDE7_9GAMM|nr:LuxR C-terminal-related transcriptional regulator [Legionella gratiana]KTD06554.1 transcriptional regulator-like protein [Legionella gratiana]STX45376.1 transcriptional regulator-like protein [Legionella gratiana]
MIPKKLLTYTKTIFEYSHSTVYIKDKNCHYQYMNNNGLKRLQLQEQEILCMPDKVLPFGKYADFYNSHDYSAMEESIYFQLDDCITKTGEKIFALSHKLPLKDEDGRTHGVIGFTKFMDFHELISNINSKNTFLAPNLKININVEDWLKTTINLSRREMEILYYFLQGKAIKIIAALLSIAERTVIFHLDNIKSKWGCYHKGDIYTKAFEKGLKNLTIIWDLLAVRS